MFWQDPRSDCVLLFWFMRQPGGGGMGSVGETYFYFRCSVWWFGLPKTKIYWKTVKPSQIRNFKKLMYSIVGLLMCDGVEIEMGVWRSLSCFMFHAFWSRFCGDSIYFEVLSMFGWIFMSWPDNWLDLNHNLNMDCFALNSVGSSQEFCEEWKRFLAMKPVGKVLRKDSTKLSTLKKVIMNSEWHFYILGFKTLRSTQNLLYWLRRQKLSRDQ